MDHRYIAVKRLITSKSEHKNNYKTYCSDMKKIDVNMIINEAKKMIKLWNRGGIVGFLGIIKEENSISLAMEHVDGGNLLDYISEQGKNIGWEGKRIILSKIASALNMCHNVGIIHSDIKAENILMDHYLNPKIADFGASILC
ncbi:hypothetical protein G6F27_014164 [Rhizopus arrhizus]|nr:hypothetical protein G6F27_014164 [Rhizopus arrhizus]